MEPSEFALYARFIPGFTKEEVPGALAKLFDKPTLEALDLHHAPGSNSWWKEQSMELIAGVGVLDSGTLKEGDFMPWQISSYAYRTPERTVLVLYVPIQSEHDDPDMTWNLAKDIAKVAAKLSSIDYIVLTTTGDHPDDQTAKITDADLDCDIPPLLAPWLFIRSASESECQQLVNEVAKLDIAVIAAHEHGIEFDFCPKYQFDLPQSVAAVFRNYFGDKLRILLQQVS